MVLMPLLSRLLTLLVILTMPLFLRSEERRVGKECRCRGSVYNFKKKHNTNEYVCLMYLYDFIRIVSILLLMFIFFFSSRRRHTRSVSAFLLNRSSDLHFYFLCPSSSRLW